MATMLRIQRASNGKIVFRLSGRIEADDMAELRRLFDLESSAAKLTLHLRDLVLADGDAVDFLAGCEAAGMSLADCPAYIRKWIDQRSEEGK
jgi:hypothetical protein